MAGVGTRGALRRGISQKWCFASMAGLWWTRRRPQSESPQGWPGGPFFSATLSAPRPDSRAGWGGGCLSQRLYAANRHDRPPRGSARMSAFPRPLLALHPCQLKPAREECVVRRGKSSRRSAGRDIRRTAGRASSWCPLDLGFGILWIWGWGLQETRLLSCSLLGWCSCSFSARAWRVARRRGSGATTTRIGFQESSRPFLDRNTLAGAISISSPESLPAPTGGSQKVVLPNLYLSDSKTSAHPLRTLSSLCVAHTQQASSSSHRNTTLGADVARECLYPRTSHLRPLGMSATLSVWVRRMASTASRVCCDFSSYRLYPATS